MYSNKDTTKCGGFPHSEICGLQDIDSSPQLIAVYHVLHRLSVPRHPLNALIRLIHTHINFLNFLLPYKLFKYHTLKKFLGGGERDRTDDLMLAKHALSQLSYTPT